MPPPPPPLRCVPTIVETMPERRSFFNFHASLYFSLSLSLRDRIDILLLRTVENLLVLWKIERNYFRDLFKLDCCWLNEGLKEEETFKRVDFRF